MPDPLGIYGETVGQLADVEAETSSILAAEATAPESLALDMKRRRKYARARAMAQLLQHKDLAGCHAWMQSRSVPVTVNVKPAIRRSGFFTNLQSCGLVHLCAHCQPKIAARRAAEVQQAIEAFTAEGGAVFMVTLTLSHGLTDPLAQTLAALKDAGRRFAQHRSFKGMSELFGLAGRIVATELTHGANGWHPHQHQLWFLRPSFALRDDPSQYLRDELAPAWRASLVKAGFTASDEHGVRVNGAQHAAQYVAKMAKGDGWTLADELTRSASKVGRNGSRSVWEIVDELRDRTAPVEARAKAATLLREYERCIKGTKALSWSPGMKKRFQVDEVTDAELAEEAQEPDTVPVAYIPPESWPKVLHHRVQADVLTIAEDHGAESVAEFVQSLPELSPDERQACRPPRRPPGPVPRQNEPETTHEATPTGVALLRPQGAPERAAGVFAPPEQP